MASRRSTHVGLDVEVLEVESVLPDVDTDDGDEAEEGVLVGGGSDLEALSLGVVALLNASARGLMTYLIRLPIVQIHEGKEQKGDGGKVSE